jgi:hypothetical protein
MLSRHLHSRALSAVVLTALATLAGCASTDQEDGGEEGAAGALSQPTEEGILYFHGMSHLGLDPKVVKHVAESNDVLTPSMSDSELQSPPPSSVLAFLKGRTTGIVSGYSLGRIPVFRLMKSAADGMTRVVMIDPTFDSASGLGSGIGGPTAKAWLDGGEGRTFLLVYGDETKSLKGEQSYVTALTGHAGAELCFVPGDHARFRQPDMAFALVAKDCDDLKAHLSGAASSAQ